MPKLGILNSHNYAARGDAGIRLEAASLDLFARDRGAAAAGEEVSVCNVHHGPCFCKRLGAEVKLLNREQPAGSVPRQGIHVCLHVHREETPACVLLMLSLGF